MDKKRRLWLAELRAAEKKPRVLVHVPEPTVDDRETCVMCEAQTEKWLFPENAPICSQQCLDEYLEDPTVYDPRGLHTLKIVVVAPKKPRSRAKKKKKRWEPSEEEIAEMQDRIAASRRKRTDEDG